jgi:hypothetical protein
VGGPNRRGGQADGADPDRPRPPGGGFERMSNPAPDPVPPPRRPRPSVPTQPARAPAVAPRPPVVELAGRFGTAPDALRCLGALAAADRAHAARIRTGDGSWWIGASVELDIGRTAVHTARGVTHVSVDGRYVRDRGFGPAPIRPDPDSVDPAGLADATLLGLVQAAGLRPARPEPVHEAVVLVPGYGASDAVRRGLELGLAVSYRPVRLHPLFDDMAEPTTMVEILLHSGPAPIPPALLAALARHPLTLVCRAAGEGEHLLVQHRMATPLSDAQLAALVDGGTWVLADAAFGCWRREPLGDPVPGAGLVRLDTGFTLQSQRPLGEQRTASPAVVRLTPARLPGQRVDAVLLHDADLENATLLLEHHPLSDIAVIVPGRDRHLLLAAGGTLEDLAVGEALACVGPGPLYVPLGHRLTPRLPPSARRALFEPDEHHAVVVLDGCGLRFMLDNRRPVWTLWAGPGPAIDTQLPGRSLEVLRDLAAREPQPPAPAAPAPRWWSRSQPTAAPQVTWRDEALAAELAGDLVRAAELHRRHNEPLRAAHLFERAAEQSAGS